MGMKYSLYFGLATVVFRISGNFPNWRGINNGFFDLPKQMLEFIFLVRHRKTSIIRENLSFPDYRGFPVTAEKNGLQIWNLHPKKLLIKQEKDVFLYVHKVKYQWYPSKSENIVNERAIHTVFVT